VVSPVAEEPSRLRTSSEGSDKASSVFIRLAPKVSLFVSCFFIVAGFFLSQSDDYLTCFDTVYSLCHAETITSIIAVMYYLRKNINKISHALYEYPRFPTTVYVVSTIAQLSVMRK